MCMVESTRCLGILLLMLDFSVAHGLGRSCAAQALVGSAPGTSFVCSVMDRMFPQPSSLWNRLLHTMFHADGVLSKQRHEPFQYPQHAPASTARSKLQSGGQNQASGMTRFSPTGPWN